MSENTTGTPERKVYEKPSGDPKLFRIIAVILWVLGIACEVVAICLVLNVFALPGNMIVWLTVALVLDLILVVIGSLLWKRANKIDPPSEKNKVEFFIKTQLGAIVAVVAFFPVLLILLTDKNMDKKSKTIVSIIAGVCLLLAVGLSIDYNPVSAEDLQWMQQNAEESDFGPGIVQYSKNSKVYHTWKDCYHLGRVNAENLNEENVETALAASKNRLCKTCAKHFNIANKGVEDFVEGAVGAAGTEDADTAGAAEDVIEEEAKDETKEEKKAA